MIKDGKSLLEMMEDYLKIAPAIARAVAQMKGMNYEEFVTKLFKINGSKVGRKPKTKGSKKTSDESIPTVTDDDIRNLIESTGPITAKELQQAFPMSGMAASNTLRGRAVRANPMIAAIGDRDGKKLYGLLHSVSGEEETGGVEDLTGIH